MRLWLRLRMERASWCAPSCCCRARVLALARARGAPAVVDGDPEGAPRRLDWALARLMPVLDRRSRPATRRSRAMRSADRRSSRSASTGELTDTTAEDPSAPPNRSRAARRRPEPARRSRWSSRPPRSRLRTSRWTRCTSIARAARSRAPRRRWRGPAGGGAAERDGARSAGGAARRLQHRSRRRPGAAQRAGSSPAPRLRRRGPRCRSAAVSRVSGGRAARGRVRSELRPIRGYGRGDHRARSSRRRRGSGTQAAPPRREAAGVCAAAGPQRPSPAPGRASPPLTRRAPRIVSRDFEGFDVACARSCRRRTA